MAKKIFGVYLAKLDATDSEAYTRLELPASPCAVTGGSGIGRELLYSGKGNVLSAMYVVAD